MTDKKLDIYYFSATHWDREWYQSFQGFRFRLVDMMNEMIEVLEHTPAFKVFHFDGQTIVLEDYLEIEPQKKEKLQTLIAQKRILIGPWYVMPDEFLLSGESLIRNLMMGHRIAHDFGVESWKYGYICDIFGHIAQMPQIFNGFDIGYALLGRGTNEHSCPAHFRWQSPDDSECITFKVPDSQGYGSFALEVIGWEEKTRYKDEEELLERIEKYVERELTRSEVPVVVIMDGMDHERIHPDTPYYLSCIKKKYPSATIHHENLCVMGQRVKEYATKLPVKSGELNETGKKKGGFIHLITHTLSSRYLIKQANDVCQALLEKWVEPLSALYMLRGHRIQRAYTDLAYKNLIQNHPHDSICGCSIDQVHKDMDYRFDQTKMIAGQLIDSFKQFEVSPLANGHQNDRLLVLFNPLPFERQEVVTVDIHFPPKYPTTYQEPFGYEEKNSFKIYSHVGEEIPYGLVGIQKNMTVRVSNQQTQIADVYTVSFEASLPAMGTVQYKVSPFEEASRYLDVQRSNEFSTENEFLALTIHQDGTIHLFDKQTGRIYDKLLSYIDDGEIGDGWFHVNPTSDRVVSSLGHACTIEKVESGPARTVFCVSMEVFIPASMVEDTHGIRRSTFMIPLKIVSTIGLSKTAKMVDVETKIQNTAYDHRVRLKLPTGIGTDTFFANQPFYMANRKTGIQKDTSSWKECDVMEKQMGGIVGKRAKDGTGLAFISPFGLHECAAQDDEEGTLLVTLYRSFRKTVMTNGEVGGQLLHDLHFNYAIAPLSATDSDADLIKMQDVLQTGIQSLTMKMAENQELAVPKSYLIVTGTHICTSIVKPSEDGQRNKIILRLYNMSDGVTTATVKSHWKIEKVTLVDLNEQEIHDIESEESEFHIVFEKWKVKTFAITMKI